MELKEFEIYIRLNRITDRKSYLGNRFAKTKREAINRFAATNNNVWVSAKEV